MKHKLHCILLVVGLFVNFSFSYGQFISIDINSGNPAFPFPQFLEYKAGKTLAKYNAEGVTHADMEKTMREAYEIMTHRCRYEGGTHCNVPYITFNSDNVQGNYGTFCSEGDGYILLAAAMFADQPTFNGLWMWMHDNRLSNVVKYKDCQNLRPGQESGPYLPGWEANENTAANDGLTHSATDGDFDMAMGLLIAYKQWGEFMYHNGVQVKDACGNPISYKDAAERMIKALVDTLPQIDKGSGQISGYLCGDIGIDGYVKSGNTWGELTQWRFNQTTYPWARSTPNLMSQYGTTYIDYNAPSYFNEFAHWLENGDGNGTNWQINQFKRAEASSDWLMGQAYNKGYIASIGKVSSSSDTDFSFSAFNSGEDFRFAWRHILNYVWHGNPTTNWDPVTHQVIGGSNSYEYDMAQRHSKFLKNPTDGLGGAQVCKKMGASPDPGQPSWWGVCQIQQAYNMNGTVMMAAGSNYTLGASAAAAVASEDLEFIADMYRQSELVWDDASAKSNGMTEDERYILSTPKYFHGWFRVLGLLTCSGNLHAPRDMVKQANMKVYMSVDKTYAYQGDKIEYTVQYRNYGSDNANGVVVTTELDPNYEFVSATKGGTLSGNKIVWNIGSVPGFVSGGLNATIDSVSFIVVAKDTLNPRICLTSTISGSNFDNWVSNEYPNHATYTMERNCVDILANRTLKIKKSASRTSMNPGDVVSFTVDFENSSEGESSWLNGGRDNVRLSYGNYMMSGAAYTFYQYYRFWHDAPEAYINMNNYRVSYFMYDAAAIGLYSPTNPTGWDFSVDNQNDLDKYGYNPAPNKISFAYQKIPVGSDANGKWNQRLMIRFADVLTAPATHVYDKLDSDYLLHKGVKGPGFIRAALKSNPAQELTTRVQDDWSYSSNVAINSIAGQDEVYSPISPGWATQVEVPINNYARHVCSPTSVNSFNKVLVEEFDGYTWRRIQGNGPLPGREAYNVTVLDTIPYELEWVGWKDSLGLKIEATYTPAANPKSAGYTGIVKWTIPEMLVGEKDKLIYICKARDLGCPDAEDTYYFNVAWISSDTDSPDSSRVELMTTCAELPPVIDPQESLFKSADKKFAEIGEIITYELKFKNTEGTRVDANCTTQSGWKALGSGTVAAVGTGGMRLSTTGSGPYFFAQEKSYGKDGSVTFTIGGTPSSTQELYFVMRYISGTPGQANFKGVCMKMMVNKDGKNNFGYELYNDGTLIAKEGQSWADVLSFPGDYNAPTFKFVLNGDHLYMYINDAEEEWINVVKDWTGLSSAGPGYFGMYVNSNGNSNTVLSSYISELDYAFDITLYDDLPDELSNITNISDGGVWNQAKNYITWPTIATTVATAMAPNDSIKYTFEAEVVSCNNFINNYGLATVYGLDTLKVLNTVECGATECALDSVSVSLKSAIICETDSTVLKAKASPKGTYMYEFFLDGVSMGSATKTDSIHIKKAGKYSVTTYDISDETCFVKSKSVTLKVDTVPALNLGTDITLCAGETATLKTNIAADFYEWNDGSTKDSLVVDTEGEYILNIIAGACPASDTVNVTVVAALVASLGNDTTICYGETLLLDGGTASGYEWSTGETTQTITVDASGEYIVKLISGSCSANDTINVTVAAALVASLGNDTTICYGETLLLDGGVADEYEWSPGETTQTITVDASGEYFVKLISGNCSVSDTINVTVAAAIVASLGNDTTICYGETLLLDGGIADEYEWSTGETTQTITVDASGEYFVKLTSGECSVSDTINVTVAAAIELDLGEDQSLCIGDDLTIDAGVADEYKWNTGETTRTITVNSDGQYYVNAKVGNCTANDTINVTFGSANLTGGGFELNGNPVSDRLDSICPNTVATLTTTHITDPATDYVWSAIPTDATMISSGASLSISPSVTTTYYVNFTKKCEAVDSITIVIAQPMKIEVVTDTLCGSVELTANSTTTNNAVYEWEIKDEGITHTGATFAINKSLGIMQGIATVKATAPDACASEPLNVPFGIIDMELTVKGSPSVCPGGTTTITVVPASTEATPTYTYQWKKDGITQTETTSQIEAGPGVYSVTVSTPYCTKDTTHTVTEGSGELKGTFTVNGEELNGMPKTYGSCGEELTIVADYETTGSAGFQWSTEPGNTTNTIQITPTTDTEVYLQFENQCTAYDTLKIRMLTTVDLEISETRNCEQTTLVANSSITGAKYTWTEGVNTTTAKKQDLIPQAGITSGILTIYAEAAGYCKSEEETYDYTIDTLGVSLSGDQQICSGTTATISATIATTATETETYSWSSRPAGTTTAFTAIPSETSSTLTTTALTAATEYEVTVTSGSCEKTARITVDIIKPERDGAITVDGTTVNPAAGIKTYKTCGLSPIQITVTHTSTDNSSFAWTSTPADASMTPANGRTISVQPDATTTYIVNYENQCPVSDTIVVEVYPLAVTADWSDFATPKCEGSQTEATVTITGYDSSMPGSYIRWYKDGVELTAYSGLTTLTIAATTQNDAGEYSYEVSNGICTLPQTAHSDNQQLAVMPYTSFAAGQSEYIVVRGENQDLTIENIVPASATITWTNGATANSGNPLTLTNVQADQTWEVEVSANGYCSTTEEVTVKVDAKINVSLTSEKTQICQDDNVKLAADTTGTGHILTPSAYTIKWEAKKEGGIYQEISRNIVNQTVSPLVTTTYRVTVEYATTSNPQTVYSEEIKIEVYPPATYLKTVDATVCEGGTIEIGISNLSPSDATIAWTADNTIVSGSLTGMAISVSPEYNPSGVQYNFTISQAGKCEQTDYILVTVEQPVEYTMPENVIMCEGDNVQLKISGAPSSTLYEWRVSGETEILGKSATLKVSPEATTTYEVTLQHGVCPAIKEEVQVEISSAPRITEIVNIKLREVEILTESGYGTEPFMYKVDNEEFTGENPLTVKRYGLHTYTVKDVNGCEASQKATLDAPAINPPPYFTPDENERSTWEVPGLAESYPDAVISIYDRFGKKLVEMKATEGGWDGTYNGKKMPTTDYWYEINVEEIDKIYVGHFTLLR